MYLVSVDPMDRSNVDKIKSSLASDPSMFIPNIDFIGEKTMTMYLHGKEENNVPVFSYLAKYKDSQDVVINVNKRIGGTRKELEDYAWKVAEPLGRIPAYIKTGTKRINVNYGKKNQVVVIIGHFAL